MSRHSESRKSLFTPEEISSLAKEFFPSTEVEIVDFDVLPYSKDVLGYLGVHELLKIRLRHGHDDKTLTFFVKTLAPSGNEFDRMAQREESAFYREALPRLLENYEVEDPWAPKCYLARKDVLVLEDLKSAGFEVISKPLEANELKSTVASVARFHVSSMLLEKRLKKPLDKVFGEFFKEKTFINDADLKWKWLQTGIEAAEAVAENLRLDPRYVLKAYEEMMEKIKPVEGQRNVLGHSDLWSNNMMFNGDGSKCRLVDFQMVSYIHYVIDLVQLIYLNTTKESRSILEKEMVEHYHAALEQCFRINGVSNDDIIRLDQVYSDVEEKRICGLVTAVQFFPIALFNKEMTEEYTKDNEKLQEYMYVSRKDFVLRAMQLDDNYRIMIEKIVKDLIEFMVNRESDVS